MQEHEYEYEEQLQQINKSRNHNYVYIYINRRRFHKQYISTGGWHLKLFGPEIHWFKSKVNYSMCHESFGLPPFQQMWFWTIKSDNV